MNEEELCERICQLEKELKEEKEKNKRIKDGILYVCRNVGRRNGKTHELKMVLEEYISKDKIRDLIAERKFELQQEFEDFDKDIVLKVLEKLLEE